MENVYSRTSILLGIETLTELTHHHILIAGLGGVGSFVAEALGRVGIEHLTLLDHDIVSLSNLNRQLVALHSTLGQKKTEVMAARLRDINPNIQLTRLSEFLYPEQATTLIESQKFSYVVDCIDTIASKAALVASCLQHQVPVASSLGAGNRLDVTQVRVARLAQTKGCPLARNLRARLRKLGVSLDYPVVYSEEIPLPPLSHEEMGRHTKTINGTIAYLPALFGMMLAGIVVQSLLKSI
jgi:tRNA A37 threonylcarbamoyladenosine dehydratase